MKYLRIFQFSKTVIYERVVSSKQNHQVLAKLSRHPIYWRFISLIRTCFVSRARTTDNSHS